MEQISIEEAHEKTEKMIKEQVAKINREVEDLQNKLDDMERIDEMSEKELEELDKVIEQASLELKKTIYENTMLSNEVVS